MKLNIDYETLHVITFFILQLLNVFFSTIKSMILINGKPSTAAFVNAFYYAFYNYLLIMITKENLLVVIFVSFFTNLIGVYCGKKIVEKFQKEKLWIYEGFIQSNEEETRGFKYDFEYRNIQVVYSEVKPGKLYELKVFAENKEDSDFTKEYFKRRNIKYHITETV